MKTKAICLMLALALLGSAAVPARAAGFTDVPAGAWYEKSVELCAGKGLMVGTGGGAFSPGRELMRSECTALALRLYDLLHGGDGTFEAAPEEWGLFTLKIEGERELQGYGKDWSWITMSEADDGHLGIRLDGSEMRSWGERQAGKPAVLTLPGGETWPGTMDYVQVGDGRDHALMLEWTVDGETHTYVRPDRETWRWVSTDMPSPGDWRRDMMWYREEKGLDDPEKYPALRELGCGSEPATRYAFAQALAEAAGELPVIHPAADIPDLDRELFPDIYRLYEAGIVAGVDRTGRFAGDRTLTRAEAAAMIVRVLEPSLRV